MAVDMGKMVISLISGGMWIISKGIGFLSVWDSIDFLSGELGMRNLELLKIINKYKYG